MNSHHVLELAVLLHCCSHCVTKEKKEEKTLDAVTQEEASGIG
jgi:hypothetical protein